MRQTFCVAAIGIALFAPGPATADTASPAQVAASSAAPQVCVQVRIGTEHSTNFRCLNALLLRLVDQESLRRAALQAAQDAATAMSPTQVGLYNETATHERLGNAFGHSAFPQRPVYNYHVPLLH